MNRRHFIKAAIGSGVAMNSVALAAASRKVDAMPDYKSTGARLIADSSPSKDGFRFPAEWERHERTLMVLPSPHNWRPAGFAMPDVRQQWFDIANAISEYEPVLMVVRPADRRFAKAGLSGTVELLELPVNDGWARDSGPMFLIDGKRNRRVAGFTFNGWGGKFPPFRDDALLKAHLSKHLKTPMYPLDLVLEGGGVHMDGEGTILTTEQCLLHKNRNPAGAKAKMEKLLCESLGAKKVIWLSKGLEPDPVTDGHIDGIAAFAAPGVVLLHTTNERGDPNYAICRDAKKRLAAARDAKGRQLEVIEMPLTSETVTHMNFYIANDVVIAPTSGNRRADARPLAILREAFPKRDVVGVNAEILGEGGGGIHCVTQQIPALS